MCSSDLPCRSNWKAVGHGKPQKLVVRTLSMVEAASFGIEDIRFDKTRLWIHWSIELLRRAWVRLGVLRLGLASIGHRRSSSLASVRSMEDELSVSESRQWEMRFAFLGPQMLLKRMSAGCC